MKQIIRIDASGLANSHCMLKTYYKMVSGYTSKCSNISLVFGIAFHKFAEVLETSGEFESALIAARNFLRDTPAVVDKNKEHLNAALLTIVCDQWYNQFYKTDNFKTSLAPDGKPMVELKFAVPYYVDDELEIVLCGTIDRVGRIGTSGVYCIPDYKTTSALYPDIYLSNYKASGQIRIYQYAIRWLARNYPNSIFGLIVGDNGVVGSRIDGVFHNKDMSKLQYKSSEVFYFNDQQIADFDTHILRPTVEEFVQFVKNPNRQECKQGFLTGGCESWKFGRCEFFGACNAIDNVARDFILEQSFVSKPYNPLAFNE